MSVLTNDRFFLFLILIGLCAGCEVRVPVIDEIKGKLEPKPQSPQTVVTTEVDTTSAIIKKARVAEQKRQDTQWTTDNIQKEPVLYLQSAIKECEVIVQRLDTQLLALGIKMNQSSRETLVQAKERELYQKFLDTAKAKYREVSTSGVWPAELNGVTVTEEQLKRKIVEASGKVDSCVTLVSVHQQNVNKLERKLAEIAQKQQEVSALKRKLSLDLEVAKVKKAIDDIDGIKDTVNAMMDISNALVSGAGEPALEDMVLPTVTSKLNSDFEKIMGK
ncbi:MAG: hypothetical protein PHU80_12005 [Kiritimatiellae bacterium]|nr:hypothetical protein [Kiritimatiellia bacterium]